MHIDENLRQFATERQKQHLDAMAANKSIRAAAASMEISHSALLRSMKSLERRAVLQNYSPDHGMTRVLPSPLVLTGTSTLTKNPDTGEIQWIKSKVDARLAEAAIQEFLETMVEGVMGLSPTIQAPKYADEDLLAVYPMGDPHFGLYAWKDECGDDFNLDIAEDLTKAAIDRLVACAPAAAIGLLLELGDFFHMDSTTNTTARSSNVLDVDTRWAKVMQIGLRAMIYCILRMLEKHQTVIVRVNKGNHDTHSSFALALALDAYFAKDPRVIIDLNPSVHWYYKFGACLIGSTHGDTSKMADLPAIMACDVPQDWGNTTHRYWFQGHIHHEDRKEFPGVVVEAFRTLAARDAWHSGQGYRAGRDMRCIVMHKAHGEIERHRCDIGMLQAVSTKPKKKLTKNANKT